jgi:hypothetical protein
MLFNNNLISAKNSLAAWPHLSPQSPQNPAGYAQIGAQSPQGPGTPAGGIQQLPGSGMQPLHPGLPYGWGNKGPQGPIPGYGAPPNPVSGLPQGPVMGGLAPNLFNNNGVNSDSSGPRQWQAPWQPKHYQPGQARGMQRPVQQPMQQRAGLVAQYRPSAYGAVQYR